MTCSFKELEIPMSFKVKTTKTIKTGDFYSKSKQKVFV